jgi:hypothetical protein
MPIVRGKRVRRYIPLFQMLSCRPPILVQLAKLVNWIGGQEVKNSNKRNVSRGEFAVFSSNSYSTASGVHGPHLYSPRSVQPSSPKPMMSIWMGLPSVSAHFEGRGDSRQRGLKL